MKIVPRYLQARKNEDEETQRKGKQIKEDVSQSRTRIGHTVLQYEPPNVRDTWTTRSAILGAAPCAPWGKFLAPRGQVVREEKTLPLL